MSTHLPFGMHNFLVFQNAWFSTGLLISWSHNHQIATAIPNKKKQVENMRFVNASSDINWNLQHQNTGSKCIPHIFWRRPCFENSRFFERPSHGTPSQNSAGKFVRKNCDSYLNDFCAKNNEFKKFHRSSGYYFVENYQGQLDIWSPFCRNFRTQAISIGFPNPSGNCLEPQKKAGPNLINSNSYPYC